MERHLKNRYGELFGAEFDVSLHDLTSTFVEGAAEMNPMVRRAYSRDHRPHCEKLVMALIVKNEGFPFSCETFDCDRTDVATMETILRIRRWLFREERRHPFCAALRAARMKIAGTGRNRRRARLSALTNLKVETAE